MVPYKRYVALVIALTVPSIAFAEGDDVVQRTVTGISKIHSYDVTYALETLVYPNLEAPNQASRPERVQIDNKRDAFAMGRGRRFEDFVGTDNHITTVLDWQAASFRENRSPAVKVSAAISSFVGSGDGYLGLFNPNCSGYFLSDLLRDKGSAARMLDGDSPRAGLIGFEVDHPQVSEPLRIWVDPERGYMPSIIETFFIGKDGKRQLDERTQVTEFVQIGDGAWAPTKGTHDILLASGVNTGKSYTGTSLVVDVKRSSWNSISSGALFTEASMPSVNNNVSEDGFKRHYPPKMLAQINQAKQRFSDTFAAALSRESRSRFALVIAVNVLVVIALAVIVVWRRYRRHQNAC